MESESQNSTSLRASPTEDTSDESENGLLSKYTSIAAAMDEQTQHSSLNGINDLDLDRYPEDSEQKSKSLPAYQSLESSSWHPVSYVSPLASKTVWSEEEKTRTSPDSNASDFLQHEDDRIETASPPLNENNPGSPVLSASDDEQGEARPFMVSNGSASISVTPDKTTSSREVFAEDNSDLVPAGAPQPSVKSPSFEKTMTTKHGIRVKVYVGDIIKANAEAVVAGDNPYSSDMSMVTRALCSSPGGSEFKEKRERRRLTKDHPLTNGKVYTIHIQNQEFPFTYVLQAIISPFVTSKTRPGTFKKLLKVLYKNIYKKADMKDIKSVAVPLLGTGRGHGSAEESVEAAVRTLCKYHPLSLQEVQFVSLDRGVNDYLAAICESCCSISDESSSDEEVPEEADKGVTSQTGSFTGVSQTKSVSVSVSATLQNYKKQTSYNYSSEPDNILLTPPITGTQPAVALSSALPDETPRPLTRAERMQKLMSHAGETGNSKPRLYPSVPISDVEDDALNVIPEVNSSFSSMTFENSQRKTRSVSADVTKVDENEGDNVIEESRSSYLLEVGGVPVSEFDTSSNDNDLLETYCGRSPTTSVKSQVGSTFWPPLAAPSDKTDDFDSEQEGYIYNESDNGPDYWRYPEDTVVEYGSDDDDYAQKCSEADYEFEPVIDANLVQTGNQPPGTMSVAFNHIHLPGYEDAGTIVITYQIPSGIQTEDHPHPGRPYEGVHRRAFLPDNEAGRMVLRMLKIAFDRKLIFTIGRSLTTGKSDVVRWGFISHKTSRDGGVLRYGYPDIDYLDLVTNELLNLGITDTESKVVDDMNSLVVDDTDHGQVTVP